MPQSDTSDLSNIGENSNLVRSQILDTGSFDVVTFSLYFSIHFDFLNTQIYIFFSNTSPLYIAKQFAFFSIHFE